MTEQIAACAHRRVEYRQMVHVGGSRSDSWICRDCATEFYPSLEVHRLEAENASMRRALAECAKLEERDVIGGVLRRDLARSAICNLSPAPTVPGTNAPGVAIPERPAPSAAGLDCAPGQSSLWATPVPVGAAPLSEAKVDPSVSREKIQRALEDVKKRTAAFSPHGPKI